MPGKRFVMPRSSRIGEALKSRPVYFRKGEGWAAAHPSLLNDLDATT
jgi:hypothetical protein